MKFLAAAYILVACVHAGNADCDFGTIKQTLYSDDACTTETSSDYADKLMEEHYTKVGAT